MKRHAAAILAAAVAVLSAGHARAWDEITHGHITDMAVARVRDPELKAFLLAHRDAVQSGSAFPDWGHAIKPHGEALHARYLDVAFDDLTAPGAGARPGHDAFLAHYLGAYAHVVEDRVLDCTLKEQAKVVGERRDDMENGMLAIAGEGYLRRDYTPFVPEADLARVYARAGYFGDPRLNASTLASVMRRGMTKGAIQNRELKLLSFLTYDWARREFPWGYANIERAPGGFESNADAVTAGWEAIWAQLHGRPAPFFVYSLPGEGGTLASADRAAAYGRITVVARHRFAVTRLDPAWVHLVGDRSGPVPVVVRPYLDDGEHDIDLAFQIEATRSWTPGEIYRLTLDGPPDAAGRLAAAPLTTRFRVPTGPRFTDRAKAPRPWRLGLFLAMLVGGVGGAIAGAPDVARLALRQERPWRVARGLALVVGLGLGGLALWLLATDGVAVIDFLRAHH